MTSPGGVALAGAVALDVEPDARSFYPRLRAQVLPAADAVGRDMGRQMAAPIVEHVSQSTGQGVRASARPAQQAARRAGEDVGAAMGRSIKTRVQAALSTVPEVEIKADSSSIEKKTAAIRRQLVELSDQRIETDIDEEKALAKIQILRNQLSSLAREVEKVREAGGEIPLDVDALAAGAAVTRLKSDIQELRREADQEVKLQVKAEAAAAKAEMRAAAAERDRLDGSTATINVDVDSGGAVAQLAAMSAASFAATGGMQILLSVAALLGPVIVPAAAAAVAGLGAIGPAALAAVAGLGVLVLALSGVMGAVKALNEQQAAAGQTAAQAAAGQARIAAAADQVAAAERGLANARANAGDSARRSAEQVRQAVEQLADAEAAARVAREDLTRAQEEARRAQEDLNISVKEGALSQRGAALDLEEAKQNLADTMADPRASELERQRAQLHYDQAVQRVESLGVRQKRLEQEQAAAQRAGIEGSRQVLAARERIADADERVADAQRRVAEARMAQAAQERQSAYSIAQAQQAVINSQRSLKQAHEQAGAAGAAAANKVAEAMGGLSPAGQEFARFIAGLKGQFTGLRQAAESGLLPGLQEGIQAFLPMLPQVETFISRVATAMGDLFRKGGKALTSPFWQKFFDMLGKFAGPALDSLGTILEKTAEGFAGLFLAFMPLSEKMLDGLAEMATGFAEWAAELATSDGFQDFIDYAIENGPMLLGLLGDLVVLVVKLGIAFAPLGAILLKGLAVLVGWLASLDPAVLAGITAAVLGIAAAIALAAGGPITLLVAAIVATVAAVLYAWNRFEGFRDVVTAVFSAVATAAVWLWREVLQPAFAAWWGFAQTMATVYMWLWTNAIKPAFEGIAAVAMWLWRNVTVPVFSAIRWWIAEVVIPVVMFLWRNVVSPAFAGISAAISIAWAAIQVVFGLFQIGLKILAGSFTWLWQKIVEPSFRGIMSIIRFMWNENIKPILTTFGNYISTYVAPAFKRGVSAIETAWKKVQDVAKLPIKFVVETVLNNGLLAAYNKIAKMFGVKPDDVQIALPANFATGGHVSGMGGPTSDSVAARLSAGEYVIPTHIVRRFGVPFFDWLIGKTVPASRRAVQPGDGSEGLAFAGGGFFGGLEEKWNTLTDPVGWVKDKVNELIGQIPGAANLKDMVVGFGRWALDSTVKFVRDKITNAFTGEYRGPVSDDVASVQAWIHRQHGKPYVWAGVGPDGYDCSGMVGAVYNLMHGKSPHRRTFTTHNQAQFFPIPGWGEMTAGWAHAGERGGGRVGHTAANLAGLAFESRGSDGVVVGDRATPVGNFARTGHFDVGGWLLPGLTVAYNGTGQPERILTGPQWADVQTRLGQASQAGGGPLIGSLTLAPTSERVVDQMDEVAYALRRIRLGGVHA
ncbi:hypothetical protein AB0B88_16200 [Micromonospora haikouensis]|uniref:hypothetical protein n=1 Tax=Micromonospora haikouensis TaxID=686309 RepID=UPI0033F8D6EC